ncbi:hypothetical protein C8J56DRAFT_1051417 [Mycena floridula]|nr:hypothetical protein C8J56DRAFT_1051417 [Mycena floridula]
MFIHASALFVLVPQLFASLVSAAPLRRSNTPVAPVVNLDNCPQGIRLITLVLGGLSIQYCEKAGGGGVQGDVHFAQWPGHTGVLKVYKKQADFDTEAPILTSLGRSIAQGNVGGKPCVLMRKETGHLTFNTAYFIQAAKNDGATYKDLENPPRVDPAFVYKHCEEMLGQMKKLLDTAMKDFTEKTNKVHVDPNPSNLLWPDALGKPTLIDFASLKDKPQDNKKLESLMEMVIGFSFMNNGRTKCATLAREFGHQHKK